jgi:cysteine desulfurase
MVSLSEARSEEFVYLDHAASSPIRPRVVAAMQEAQAFYANPSGSHRLAREARARLESARETVASALGCQPNELLFTSGGTESDNMAVLGTLGASTVTSPQLLVSAIEHKAVLAPAHHLAQRGDAQCHEIPVGRDGVVDLDAFESLLGEHVAVVSVMAANNETGALQPLAEIAALVKEKAPQAVLHSDAVQAAPYLDLKEIGATYDLISISAHKLGGPKGAGALVVRRTSSFEPLIRGGGQEFDRRGGTNDIVGAIGLGVALEEAIEHRQDESVRLRALMHILQERATKIDAVYATIPNTDSLPGHAHLLVEGVTRDELLVLLDREGVCASAGSSCASGALEQSHVLSAMGVSASLSRGALRFSGGWTTTMQDIDYVLEVLPQVVTRLRGNR